MSQLFQEQFQFDAKEMSRWKKKRQYSAFVSWFAFAIGKNNFSFRIEENGGDVAIIVLSFEQRSSDFYKKNNFFYVPR
jgi:hypothetical protein